MLQRPPFLQGDVRPLVTFDLILRIFETRVMDVTFVVDDLLVPIGSTSTSRGHPAFARVQYLEPIACLPVPYGLVDSGIQAFGAKIVFRR